MTYDFLLVQFPMLLSEEEEKANVVDLNITDEELAKFGGALTKQMTGQDADIFARVVKHVSGKKVFISNSFKKCVVLLIFLRGAST